jgi:cytochrome c oxidase cbb3-type subunit 3
MSEQETPRAAAAGAEPGLDQLRDHVFDGIQEFDNKLPNWWLWTLYGSIVFALAYWVVFHTLEVRDLPRAAFEREMVTAAEAQLARAAEGGLSDESLELMATIPARLEEGEALFAQYCVVCHAERGQGLVGPNLTDAYWIHGNRPLDIHRVVTEGVTAKGMAAWGNQLGPRRVESVTAYVLTLRGTNVPGKAPEGEFSETSE